VARLAFSAASRGSRCEGGRGRHDQVEVATVKLCMRLSSSGPPFVREKRRGVRERGSGTTQDGSKPLLFVGQPFRRGGRGHASPIGAEPRCHATREIGMRKGFCLGYSRSGHGGPSDPAAALASSIVRSARDPVRLELQRRRPAYTCLRDLAERARGKAASRRDVSGELVVEGQVPASPLRARGHPGSARDLKSDRGGGPRRSALFPSARGRRHASSFPSPSFQITRR